MDTYLPAMTSSLTPTTEAIIIDMRKNGLQFTETFYDRFIASIVVAASDSDVVTRSVQTSSQDSFTVAYP